MKLIFIFIFLFFANSIAGQTFIPNETELIKSLDSIKLVENLYQEINSLRNKFGKDVSEALNKYESCREQNYLLSHRLIFRELLDNLETGKEITDINGNIQSKYGKIVRKQFPTSKQILIIIDTLFDSKDIGYRLYRKDNTLKKLYPNVFKKILLRSIKFEFIEKNEVIVEQLQILRLRFPSLTLIDNNVPTKQNLAEKYLEFITNEAIRVFSHDLIQGYLILEKEQIPDFNIDKIIDLRRKFIEYLKKIYEKK